MNKIEIALNKLEEDKIHNISIINFIKNNRVLSIDFIGNSVLVKGESDRKWIYISCQDKNELQAIKQKFNDNDTNFAAIEDWMIPALTSKKKVIWDLSMLQYYLPEDVHLPTSKYQIFPLKLQDAYTVYENSTYKEYISIEYITDRIIKGTSAGIYEDNELVSWSITQDDGAIGFLHTLSNFRKKGYGYNVVLSMIEKLRNEGELPFAYIEEDNKSSINLFSKLGFKKINNIHWFEVE